MYKIDKPVILVTSLGRTGTDFFAKLFGSIIPDSTSLHEPDIVQRIGIDDKLSHFIGQVRRAGIWRMIFLKGLGHWTLVKLSDARFKGHLGEQQAIKKLHAQRARFIEHMPGSTYVESNIGYYGLLDITSGLFNHHKAIYIIRDGRDWIRSHMNWGQFYGKKGIRKLVEHNWPTPLEIPDDPYAEQWKVFSRFERLCWAWAKLNSYALETISKNKEARLFHFEDIFQKGNKYRVLDELVSFTTSQPGFDTKKILSIDGWLERRVHQSSSGFPDWTDWNTEQKKQFETICGPLMNQLRYVLR